jgi:hypothetical protein
MTTYHDLETRLIRIETRLCKLMIHLGLDPITNEPVINTPPKDYAPTPHSPYLSTFRWLLPKEK